MVEASTRLLQSEMIRSSLRFAVSQFVLNDGVHAAAARALVQGRSQLGQLFWLTRSDNLNMTVLGVAHPALQAERTPPHDGQTSGSRRLAHGL